MPREQEPFERPRTIGCLMAGIWLGLMVFTVVLFMAAIAALTSDLDNPQVYELGWWLLAAGIAGTAACASMIVLIMRIRRLQDHERYLRTEADTPGERGQAPEEAQATRTSPPPPTATKGLRERGGGRD